MTESREIYVQRYETYRYLDRLRWQMLQVAVAAGAVVLGFGEKASSMPGWWTWAALGLVFVFCGISMIRISIGIRRNAKVLRQAAMVIGDEEVPIPSISWKSVSLWVASSLLIIGLICIVLSIKVFIWK